MLVAILLSSSLDAALSDWHVMKSKELASLPEGGALRSVKVRCAGLGQTSQEVSVEGVVFNDAAFCLEVIDDPARAKRTAQILQEKHFLAGVNGGYFQPDGTPLGLVIAHGKFIHAQEKARLLSGFFVATKSGFSLLRVGEKIPADATEVLQAGPFLIDHNLPVVGLEATRSARRTFLATDNHGLWVMGVISPVTLAEASRVLQTAAPRFFSATKIDRALNLDGGSSSALWVDVKPEAFSQQEFGRVRDFLGLRLRE